MPSFLIVLFWLLGFCFAAPAFFSIIGREGKPWHWIALPLYVILAPLSIWWYIHATAIVKAMPDVCEPIGIVENMTLTGGKQISIVRTRTEVINLSDSFKGLMVAGSTYYRCHRPTTGGGIYFCGWDGQYWHSVEAPSVPPTAENKP